MKIPSLAKMNPAFTGTFTDREEVLEESDQLLKKLYDQLYLMFAEDKRSLLIVLQGIDTSGKDGVVRHIFSGVNPQGIRVHSFKQPSPEELKHDFLWRCHQLIPESGKTAIFNRSYYEEVTVVKVHPKLLKTQHLPESIIKDPRFFEKRYQHINAFEKMLSQNGVIVLKFFLHISKAEQKSRLADRLLDHTKNWKFSEQDIKERAHWNKYMKVFEEMIAATHTEHAPWHIIPANKKWYRNYLISKILVETLDQYEMKFPKLKSKSLKSLK